MAAAEDDPSIVPEILEPAGSELARMVAAVARELGLGPGAAPAGDGRQLPPELLDPSPAWLLDRLTELGYEVVASSVAEPVEGALVLARRGWISP